MPELDSNARADLVRKAFFTAQDRRPYKFNEALIAAATPPGGSWRCEVFKDAVTRSVTWRGIEVALMNPTGALDDETEGQIAMAARALPILDAAIRSIIVLAEDASNATLIRELAESVIVHVEMPAPKVPEPEE